jgi:FMN phosphatase YigB (HAD superfamily)
VLTTGETVFLLDVDNTLLDNDRFSADLRARLTQDFGAEQCTRYWTIYEELRTRLGYADYLETLQRFRDSLDDDPRLPGLSHFLLEYPFAQRLYPRALEVIAHLRSIGLPVVLSDGDIVFQPRKITRSGIRDAVDGRVMICVHKQQHIAAVRQRYPASHYVMVDDKPQLLAQMKQIMGEQLTTVFVRQGHYAAEAAGVTISPPPDRTIDAIADLCDLDIAYFHDAAAASA